MIGQLVFPDGRTAALTDELVWASEDPELQARLESDYPVDAEDAGSPFAGVAELIQAAEELGADVQMFSDPLDEE